jgi:hypothetical protein
VQFNNASRYTGTDTMRTIFVLLALTGLAYAAEPVSVRPPQFPTVRPNLAADRLIERQTAFLLASVAPGEVPNELEYAIRGLSSTAYTAAACVRLGACTDREGTRASVIRILSDLTRTHLSGGGKTATGRAWGNHWQSAFWAYQAAFAGWLLWDDLPPALREGLIRMAVHEADRFLDLPAPHAEFLDTKAEENSWNSMVLVFAAEVLEGHPHRARWRERGLEYMISAFARRADSTSTRVVDGRPLRQWVPGANVHDDYTLENHGFVHPDYMSCISMNLTNGVTYKLAGRAVPEAVTFNAAPIYGLLKFFSLPDGSLFYPNSTDWSLHQIDHTYNLHVLAARVLADRDAPALAAVSLATLGKMQGRRTDGRLWVPGEYTSYPAIEAHAGFMTSSARLSELLWPAPAGALPIEQVWKKLEGVRMFDDARLFVARTPRGVSSFAWGLKILGQTIPFQPDWIVNPLDHSYIGLSGAMPGAGDRAGRLAISSSALDAAIAADARTLGTVLPSLESGAASVTGNGRRNRTPQMFSFTALPSGDSVYMERYSGNTDGVHSGMISVLQEPDWPLGRATRQIERGANWVNIDGRLGYVMAGCDGKFAERVDYRTRTLFLNDGPSRDHTCAIVTRPGATVEETKALAARPIRLETDSPLAAAAELDGVVVVSNFSTHPTTFQVRTSRGMRAVAVNGVATRVLR